MVIAQAVPAERGKIILQLAHGIAFRGRCHIRFIFEQQHQVDLFPFRRADHRHIARTHVAPAPERTGKTQVRDNFCQQRQIFAVDLILQRDIGGADHQQLLLFPRDRNARDQIREGFSHPGRGFNHQMPSFITRHRPGNFRNHFPLRGARDKAVNLLRQGFVPGADLLFDGGGKGHLKNLWINKQGAIVSHYRKKISMSGPLPLIFCIRLLQ